jgi:hypothetical protein
MLIGIFFFLLAEEKRRTLVLLAGEGYAYACMVYWSLALPAIEKH